MQEMFSLKRLISSWPVTGMGGVTVPKAYTMQPIRRDKTVIATLLPSTEGHGLCAIGLILYLARLQNEFLNKLPGNK